MTTVHVSTPSRLHFGLLRLHETPTLGFGGLGMMIDRPRVELDLAAAAEWSVTGPAAQRARRFAEQALAACAVPHKPPALHVRVRTLVPQHRGLGGGTQLALAVAAAVRQRLGLPPGTAAELAAAVGRGARSAVGSHGFVQGGLIWERGRTRNAPLAALTARVALPESWRAVLVAPPRARGRSGSAEQRAFDRLPPVPAAVTAELERLAERHIAPAARVADLEAFGDAVYEYGRRSGACFAPIQGGPYASAEIAACVAAIRAMGVHGVGQSSWGPTVFALVADAAAADELARRLRRDPCWAAHDVQVAAPDNRGAIVAEGPAATPPVGAARPSAAAAAEPAP